jgi:hypothetical protein
MFPVWKRSDSLALKDWVYALRAGGYEKAYPLSTLFRERVVNDVVGSQPVVLLAHPGSGAVRSYARRDHVFAEGPSEEMLVEPANRQLWKIGEEQLTPLSGVGAPLKRYPGHRAYWFGWYAFFPDTAIYAGCGE